MNGGRFEHKLGRRADAAGRTRGAAGTNQAGDIKMDAGWLRTLPVKVLVVTSAGRCQSGLEDVPCELKPSSAD
jgi:hypothetical protein